MELDFYVKQQSPLSFDTWDNNFVALMGVSLCKINAIGRY
jgi:hypothetical protein